MGVVDIRRGMKAPPEGYNDMLEVFMNGRYSRVENKRKFNDDEIAGLLLAMLMAGQHTSSTTTAWLGFYVCRHPGLYQDLAREQDAYVAEHGEAMDLDMLESFPLLHSCLRETLRLRPPIMTLMRKARQDLRVTATVNGKKRTYRIPKGHQVCASPTANHMLETEWDAPKDFNPRRFIASSEWSAANATLRQVGDGKHVTEGQHEHFDKRTATEAVKRNPFKHKWVPFGSGRHRCIGFAFAQIQIRTLFSIILRKYEMRLPEDGQGKLKFPPINYSTMIHTPMEPFMMVRRRQRT